MARGEDLLRGEVHPLPPGAQSPEALHSPLAACAALRRSGNEVRNQLAVPGYGNGLPALDETKKFGKARLGFGGLNLTQR